MHKVLAAYTNTPISVVRAENGKAFHPKTFQGLWVGPGSAGLYNLLLSPVQPHHSSGWMGLSENAARALVAGTAAYFPTVFKTAAQQHPRMPYWELGQMLRANQAWTKGMGINLGLGTLTRTGMFYIQGGLEARLHSAGCPTPVSVGLATVGTVAYETFMQTIIEGNLSRVLAKEGSSLYVLKKQLAGIKTKGIPGIIAVGGRNLAAWAGWTMIPSVVQTIFDKQRGIYDPEEKHKPGFGAMLVSGTFLYGVVGTPFDVLKQTMMSNRDAVHSISHNLLRRQSWGIEGGAPLSMEAKGLEDRLRGKLFALDSALKSKNDAEIDRAREQLRKVTVVDEFTFGVQRRLLLLSSSYAEPPKMTYKNAFNLARESTGLPPATLLFRSIGPRIVMGVVTLSSLLGVNVVASMASPPKDAY